MPTESNPASRLHALLKDVVAGDPKTRMLEVWVEVLAVTERPDVEVARRLVFLNEMLDDAENTIKLNPRLNHGIYLSCFPQIRTVFSPLHLQANRENIAVPHLTAEVMARLEFCSEALRDDWSEVDLEPDELVELAAELNTLIEKVAASEIATALRKALLEALESARIAISLYRVYGAKGLRRNLQSLFGFVYTERAALKSESVKNTDVLDRLGKWIEKIDSVSSKALKVHKALTKPVRFLIEWVIKPKEGDDSGNDEAPSIEA